MRHKLLSKNEGSRTGVCQKCGPVDLFYRADRDLFVCAIARKEANYRPGRDKVSTAGHGLTKSEAEEFKRGKVCWICGATDRLVVDHCHVTGKIRGVLCANHNAALGLFADERLHLERAIHYLNKFDVTIGS